MHSTPGALLKTSAGSGADSAILCLTAFQAATQMQALAFECKQDLPCKGCGICCWLLQFTFAYFQKTLILATSRRLHNHLQEEIHFHLTCCLPSLLNITTSFLRLRRCLGSFFQVWSV